MLSNKVVAYCVSVLSTGLAGSMIFATWLDHKRKVDKEEYDRSIEARNYNDCKKSDEEYYGNLTADQKAEIERQKQITAQERYKKEQAELTVRAKEADTKQKINQFKTDILNEVRKESKEYIRSDSRKIFDDWSTDIFNKVDKKLDRLEDKLDDLKDDMVSEDEFNSLKKRVSRLSDDDERPSSGGGGSTPVITVAPVISGK